MVDANQSYSYHDVLKIAHDLAAFDLTFLEEPLPINDIEAMAALAAAVEVPIAAGENYYTRFEFRDILVKRAVNIVQPDIIHAGGITETKKIADMASAWNVPLAPHIHATVGVAASIHLLTATRIRWPPSTSPAAVPTSCVRRSADRPSWPRTDGCPPPTNRGWVSTSMNPCLRPIDPKDRWYRHFR
jgi:D-galactarolactone cycloisomerase